MSKLSTEHWASITGANIRRERKHRDFSQEGLSEKAGITPQYLSLIENGDRCASVAVYLGIANALDLTWSELVSAKKSVDPPAEDNKGAVDALFDDSSPFERRVMLAVLVATKDALRSGD